MPTAVVVLAVSLLLIGCRMGQGSVTPSASPSAGTGLELSGTVTAGPTCPVERDPPDPSCAPRPVAAATIVVQDPGGHEVARAVSDGNGRFTVDLVPGRYALIPQPVEGLRAAGRVEVDIRAGVQPAAVELTYDTGIR